MPTAVEISLASVPLDTEKKLELPTLKPRKRQPPSESSPTPILPAPPSLHEHVYRKPARKILSSTDHELFLKSSTYDLILAFVFHLSESAADTKITSLDVQRSSATVKSLLEVLSRISLLVDTHPAQDQGNSRFGNPAFRDFLDDVGTRLPAYHELLGIRHTGAISELSVYLLNAFGSKERIDYGSGHELNFITWLLCINRLSLLEEADFKDATLLVFPAYLKLMRKIQSDYYLEPAGSHGVWGLDDYQFLSFLFGASQLLHHPYIRPLGIHNDLVLEEGGDDYLYLDMVRFTMATKTVKGLKWTQPMLDDISGAKNWEKVEQGMRRMFVKEVLGKLPIMQHFLFGSLVPAVDGMGKKSEQHSHDDRLVEEERDMHKDGPGHVHRDDVWGDCCGIKIPSTVAASQEAKKHGAAQGLRPIPFD